MRKLSLVLLAVTVAMPVLADARGVGFRGSSSRMLSAPRPTKQLTTTPAKPTKEAPTNSYKPAGDRPTGPVSSNGPTNATRPGSGFLSSMMGGVLGYGIGSMIFGSTGAQAQEVAADSKDPLGDCRKLMQGEHAKIKGDYRRALMQAKSQDESDNAHASYVKSVDNLIDHGCETK